MRLYLILLEIAAAVLSRDAQFTEGPGVVWLIGTDMDTSESSPSSVCVFSGSYI